MKKMVVLIPIFYYLFTCSLFSQKTPTFGVMLGSNKFNEGNYIGAIYELSNAIAQNKKDVDAYYLRGAAKAMIKNYKGALQDFNIALKIDPKYVYAYFDRGLAKYNLGDKKGACSDWKKSLELGLEKSSDYLQKYCE